MDLAKRYIHMNREKGKAVTQITLDDDFNVPDMKPDLIRIIQDKGELLLDETTITQDHVWLKGVLKFSLLYRSDQEEGKINNMSGEIPFQESLAIDGANEYDTAKLKWEMEDLSIGIINSRKLSVKALVVLKAVIDEIYDEELLTGVDQESGVQLLNQNLTAMALFLAKKDTFRFKEEILLPSNKPNIRQVLWKSVQLRGVETRLMDQQLNLKGEALVFVLYEGEEDEEHLQWMETALPFTGVIDCNGCTEEMIADVSYDVSGVELEVKPDYDGEERMLHLELVLDLDIQIFTEEENQIVADLYAVNQKLTPIYQDTVFEKLLLRNASKCKISEKMSIDKNQEPILQICASEGYAVAERAEIVEGGIQVEGTLQVTILYVTADDRMPVASVKDVLPFHYLIEVPGINQDCRYHLQTGIDQLTTVMTDSSQVEVKAVISLNCIVFLQQQVKKITEVQQEPLDMEQLQESPGIIGYIAKEGDQLWDIAKENFTTISEIVKTNQLASEQIRGGDKILIIKTVG
ncbi:SPOCS domain-containing protein [Lachnospiraceae bacterium 45-W7]